MVASQTVVTSQTVVAQVSGVPRYATWGRAGALRTLLNPATTAGSASRFLLSSAAGAASALAASTRARWAALAAATSGVSTGATSGSGLKVGATRGSGLKVVATSGSGLKVGATPSYTGATGRRESATRNPAASAMYFTRCRAPLAST